MDADKNNIKFTAETRREAGEQTLLLEKLGKRRVHTWRPSRYLSGGSIPHPIGGHLRLNEFVFDLYRRVSAFIGGKSCFICL